MPTFQAESKNFVDLLQRIQDGDEICLKPGEYFGQPRLLLGKS